MRQAGQRGHSLVGLVLSTVFLAACVGSETGADSRAARDSVVNQRTRSAPRDTVSPAAYRVFQTNVDSESPRKVTVRLLVLGQASRAALNETLRAALDSLARSDSALVAARAILYTGRMTAPREMDLLPTAWGLWVPPEGWDSASVQSRERIHRTFVYSSNPRWGSTPADSRAGGQHE